MEKKAEQAPSDARKKQQERMKDCSGKAADRKLKGDDRKKFMSACLKGEDMSIMVYWAGAPERAEELRKLPADAYRMIHTVTPFVLGKRAIRDEAVERLPAFDHDAIEDGPVGGASETIYNLEGRWLQVF